MADGFRRLSSIVESALERSPLAEGLRDQEALRSWPEIVGTQIALNSEAVGIENGTLIVRVTGSVWAQELTLLRPRILEALGKRLGPGRIREIRFHSRTTA